MESNGSAFVSKKYEKFPFEIVRVDQATEERVSRHFKGPLAAACFVGPEKSIMPRQYPEWADTLHNFVARSDDVWISTYPRSGTTWTQEMMWLICNDLNYEAAKSINMNERFPFFEFGALVADAPSAIPPAIKIIPGMRSQRLIKTHLPIKLMPHETLSKGCKIVYVARNPKDVVVSQSYFVRNMRFAYTGNFQDFADYFMDDLITWGPYCEHLKDGWNRRNHSNVLFLFYEDLVMNLKNSLKKLSTFLCHPLSENVISALMEHLSIGNFRENNAVNQKSLENTGTGKWNFIRHGRVGGNLEMTPELADRIDAWTDERLKGTGIEFPYQLRHRIEMYKLKANEKWEKQS